MFSKNMDKKFFNERDTVILGKVAAPILIWVAAIFTYFSGEPSKEVAFVFYFVAFTGAICLFMPYKKIGSKKYSLVYLIFLTSFLGLIYAM